MHKFQVTTIVEGYPNVTQTVEAADEWKARTVSMFTYPYPLSGDKVEYIVEEVSNGEAK